MIRAGFQEPSARCYIPRKSFYNTVITSPLYVINHKSECGQNQTVTLCLERGDVVIISKFNSKWSGQSAWMKVLSVVQSCKFGFLSEAASRVENHSLHHWSCSVPHHPQCQTELKNTTTEAFHQKRCFSTVERTY